VVVIIIIMRQLQGTRSSRLRSVMGAVPQRPITNKHMFTLQHSESETKFRKMIDMTSDKKGNVGILKTNREHRLNVLTPRFLRQVSRGVRTMNVDDQVSVIMLSSEQGKVFSVGTDFKTLLHYRTNKQDLEAASYLEDLFKLQSTFAKINKPIISIAPGATLNSAAGLFAASGMPSVTNSTRLAFNECSLGFVPHAGATYYASRMPGDFGTFLLLTGMPFTGQDAIRMGMADKMIQEPQTYEDEIIDAMIAFNAPGFGSVREHLGLDNFKDESMYSPRYHELHTREQFIRHTFKIKPFQWDPKRAPN
jgi:enoyl-CoA hydratase/carnithine racemase